jgi:predicted MPP superfamily phosphohydrolase
MTESVVLHLTDLHFGWEGSDAQSKQAARTNCLNSLTKQLKQIVNADAAWKPTIVAITGDIGWGGNASDYEAAKKWLDDLMKVLGFGYDRVVVCPGNHDINRESAEVLARPETAKEADTLLRVPIRKQYVACFEAFSNFCDELGVRSYEFAGAKSYLVGKTSFDGLDVVALNSAWYCRDDSDKNRLWIGWPHLQKMQSDGQVRLVDQESGNPVLALIHHPKDWLHPEETNTWTSRPDTWDVLSARCNLILNGHTHGEVRKADRFAEGAWHLTGGSAYVGDSHFNSFRLIRINCDVFEYRSYEFDPRSAEGAWELKPGSGPIPFGKPSLPQSSLKSPKSTAVPEGYFAWLKRACAGVDLLGVRSRDGLAVKLARVYVPLITNRRSDDAEKATFWKGAERRAQDGEGKPQLLLDLFDRESLYVSGTPGSGKSTFARWVAWLCCEGQMPTHQFEGPEGYREEFPRSLQGRLPLLVKLREFHHQLPRAAGRRELTSAEFQESLAKWVESSKPGGLTWACVAQHLEDGQGLVIFDGVDEVPLEGGEGITVSYPREMLISGLADAVSEWHKKGNRLLITSRPYGLSMQDANRLGLTHAPIDRLDDKLQELLAHKWFAILKEDLAEGEHLADEFRKNVSQRTDIQELIDNPMLLTSMCILFNNGGRLPQDRHDLYERMVENVLHHRFATQATREMHAIELGVIAYSMHTGEGLGESRITPEAEALYSDVDRSLSHYKEVSRYSEEGFLGVSQTRECLLSESGLLLPAEAKRASFYHFSIQEHLAALQFLDREEGDLVSAFVKRSAVKEWRHTLSFAFGAYLARFKGRGKPVSLVEELIDRMTMDDVRLQVVIADCLEVLRGREIRLADAAERKFRQGCLAAIENEVEIQDRHVLGLALGWLGDPRLEIDLRKRDPLMKAFVRIDAGEYAYQDGRIRIAKSYYLSRYPVTNSQYEMFIKDGGYQTKDYWSAEGWVWKKDDAIDEPAFWRHPCWNCPNQPVVGVSWYEADAFCCWAGGRLPTDKEWEAAARGKDGREYPWGNHWEDGICNSFELGLGVTSSVGLFPRSRTRDRYLEDITGNVWEWCRGIEHTFQVFRGGSWDDSGIRCLLRDYSAFSPGLRDHMVGFRISLKASPINQ